MIWHLPQGLPQATIFVVFQSADGYLWLGTPTGLIRFDGVRFSTIADCAGLPPDKLWIVDLCEDRDHRLWLATDGTGLIRMDSGVGVRFTTAQGLPSDAVRCVFCDKQGEVWAGTADGLARIADKIVVYRSDQGLANNDIRAISQAHDGTLWIGGDGNKLTKMQGSTIGTYEIRALQPDESVRAILCDKDGAVWVGTTAGLIRLKDDQETVFTTKDGLGSDSILTLAHGSHDTLWVGSKNGISRFHSGEFESFSAADGLSQSSAFAMCEDREGSLWVGTKLGLNQFVDRRTLPFTIREGLPSNDAGPILPAAEGNIWVGTLGAGLARFDGRRFNGLTADDGLASNRIQALVDGDRGSIWIGTDRGLNSLRDGRVEKTYTVAQGLPSDDVLCLCRDRLGVLWVGTSGGIAKLEDGKFVQPSGDPAALRQAVCALIERRDGELIAAVREGSVYRCADGELRPLAGPGELLRDVVGFYEDAASELWMATRGNGLIWLSAEKTVQFTTKDGLYDDDIFGIAADEGNRLWMACSKGIFFVPREDLEQFASGTLKTLTCTPFSPTDGLRTFECQAGVQPGIGKVDDGRMWFSTSRGFVVVDSRHHQRVLPPAPVVVEEVIVNGQERLPNQIHKLAPGTSNLEFGFTALSFVAPPRITFRYQLEGFDSDWIDAGTRRAAFYTNLGPGHYRFRVAARNGDNTNLDVAEAVEFTIAPYFYQTRWFPVLAVFALGMSGWGLYRLRVRRITDRLRAVVAERSRIARELHDTLMQGFSGVTMEMQALSSRLTPSENRETLEEIIRDAANCLREARRSVAGLRREPNDASGLADAISRAVRQLAETNDVRVRLNLQAVPPGLPVDVEYSVLRIAQEAVANAVKHSAARTIEVSLECPPRRLRLTVHDDGVGFTTGNGSGIQSGHYGIIGMQERAKQINAALYIDSEPGQGTTVSLDMPTAERKLEAVQPPTALEDTPRAPSL